MATKAPGRAITIPVTFAELCVMHPPRPISDDADYENSVEMVDRLATLKRRSRDQDEYLETLTTLVEKYDADHVAESATPDPIRRLRRLMANHDMTASDLGRVLGNRSLGAAILRGSRRISKANAVRLGDHFKVSPWAFLEG